MSPEAPSYIFASDSEAQFGLIPPENEALAEQLLKNGNPGKKLTYDQRLMMKSILARRSLTVNITDFNAEVLKGASSYLPTYISVLNKRMGALQLPYFIYTVNSHEPFPLKNYAHSKDLRLRDTFDGKVFLGYRDRKPAFVPHDPRKLIVREEINFDERQSEYLRAMMGLAPTKSGVRYLLPPNPRILMYLTMNLYGGKMPRNLLVEILQGTKGPSEYQNVSIVVNHTNLYLRQAGFKIVINQTPDSRDYNTYYHLALRPETS